MGCYDLATKEETEIKKYNITSNSQTPNKEYYVLRKDVGDRISKFYFVLPTGEEIFLSKDWVY